MPSMPPIRLEAVPHEKIWGVPVSSGPYAGIRLGEIWFHAEPLLLKFILTSDKLSVQVHPDDAYAARHEADRGGRGKSEMWYVVEAEAGARLAAGLREAMGAMTREQLRQSALDGSLEHKLRWIEARPGDAVYVPAGTIHALGPGLVLCEIQQSSDITYRLFDYGRPRELHLEKALDMVRETPRAGPVRLPFACESFRVERRDQGPIPPGLLVVLSGAGTLDGQTFQAREVWRIRETAELKSRQPAQCLLVNH